MQDWDPTQFFRNDGPPHTPFALVILNQPINERAYAVLRKHGVPLQPMYPPHSSPLTTD